nr:immunoglobulin heavy chain junction region [Macaca mulatta]MOX58897.1 immunoglobulin heavy chain junction region [Macaca mulatta]MOX59513.1 immunoglobulin heavy chain junction region [Macaca mulatta]MOX60168.1 immunoglobulin heavy chain junction region [Macaca mulatta]MOX60247.1 immunoglobulin heavy chain junction region [Macaca mulatta]
CARDDNGVLIDFW